MRMNGTCFSKSSGTVLALEQRATDSGEPLTSTMYCGAEPSLWPTLTMVLILARSALKSKAAMMETVTASPTGDSMSTLSAVVTILHPHSASMTASSGSPMSSGSFSESFEWSGDEVMR